MGETDVKIQAGCIASIGADDAGADLVLNVFGGLALPGTVDLDGAAFDRQVMPLGVDGQSR